MSFKDLFKTKKRRKAESQTYVVLDLEWNSAYCKWEQRFLNEIIEFGAVKLDGNLKESGRFQCFVRSCLTNRLRGRFKGLTNISNEDMRSGITFQEAVRRFTEWAGKDTNTLTWSNSDIYTLLDNMQTLMGKKSIPFLYRYADMQKFVQKRLGVTGNQISLSAAAGKLGVNFEEYAAHRALGDALCSAELLRRTFVDGGLDPYLVDTTDPAYYARMTFKPYVISDLNSEFVDRQQMRVRCPDCGRYMKKTSRWQYKNRAFRAKMHCLKCGGDFIGQVRFKKYFDHVAVSKDAHPAPKAETPEEAAVTE